MPSNFNPSEHPGLGLVRVSEAGALAASRWVGRDDCDAADAAAQKALLAALNLLPMRGRIVCGEEGRTGRHSPLDTDSAVGTGSGPELDVQLNAIDGARLVAAGKSGAMSVVALTPQGTIWRPGPAIYMNKLVVDRAVADTLGPDALDAPAGWTLAAVARAKGKDISDLMVFVLDRPRHRELVAEVRQAGARVALRKAGDIGGAMMAADPNVPIDVLMGIGGAAETLLAACAVKALGGAIMARVAPQSENETRACRERGLDLKQILTRDDLVTGDEVIFSATGITDGWMFSGVARHGDMSRTHSLVLRYETGTRRVIKTEHRAV